MQLIRQIAAAAPQPGVLVQDPTLASGSAGLAVLFAYLDRAGEGRWCSDRAFSYLAEAMETLQGLPTSPSLFRGAPGVAWAAAHLGDPSQAAVAFTEQVDRAVQERVSRSPWQGPYGLSDGLVGWGLYLLERLPDEAAARCLEQVIDRLAELAERGHEGAAWRTAACHLPERLRVLAPDGCHDLGLAHGASGVIGLLGCTAATGVTEEKSRLLLNDAVEWLRSQRLYDSTSSFPAWSDPDVARRPARAAWCHGDPGVASALLVAARATRDERMERRALAIARQAAIRPPFESGVTDSGFCHGSAGLAHQFNRMYQVTGDEELRLAARFWVEQTLAMGMPDPQKPGLLRGAAGVALSLLAAASDVEPSWDRVFLLSNRERAEEWSA